MIKKLGKLYERTLNNCWFYFNNHDPKLYSEIGCLRGIAYCIEEIEGIPSFDFSGLEFFIKVSNEYYR